MSHNVSRWLPLKMRRRPCACAESRDPCVGVKNNYIFGMLDCYRNPKCPIAVVLADVDLPYWTSKIEHIAAFTAIFSNICTAHAQKRLFMNFRCKFRHRRVRFAVPDFPVECNISAIWRRFPLIFAFCMPNVRHISISGLFDLLT